MSDQPLQANLITSQLVASLAARTALETPGVLRLEPTVQGLLTWFGPAALQNLRSRRSETGTYRHDGVTATINNRTAHVHLDLATDIAYTALNVAENVQHRVQENIAHTGLIPGNIDITILAIEPRPRTPPA